LKFGRIHLKENSIQGGVQSASESELLADAHTSRNKNSGAKASPYSNVTSSAMVRPWTYGWREHLTLGISTNTVIT